MSQGLVAEYAGHAASARSPAGQQRQLPLRATKQPPKEPKRQRSRKMVARDQRNESAWQTPVFAPRSPLLEQPPPRPSNDDIFFNAYHDQSFRQLLHEWDEGLKQNHQQSADTQSEDSQETAIFGTRDGQTPETCFDILVMGQTKVGKTTFIARALGLDTSQVDPPEPRAVTFGGHTYYFKIRERSLSDLDVQNAETIERARREWEANPRRFDGCIALYDITSKESLDPLPIAIRFIQKTGKPCLLAATKADFSISKRQLDFEGIEKKVKLVAASVTATKPTSHPEGPRRSLGTLLSEIISRYNLPSPPTTPPGPKSSPSKLQSTNKARQGRRLSKSLLASAKPGILKPGSSGFDTAQNPVPHYIAVAVDVASHVPAPEPQASPGSEPFSPMSPITAKDIEAYESLGKPITGPAEELDADNIRALPSHVLELLTFEELVARVCFRDDPSKDKRFDFNFLTFYRFFASPSRLLNALVRVFGSADATDNQKVKDLIPGRVLQFLSQWLTMHPGDFADDDTYTLLEEFLEGFSQVSTYFPVAEQMRMASGKVDKDDDYQWSLPAVPDDNENVPLERKESHNSIASKSSCNAEQDAKLIFEAHSSLADDDTDYAHAHTHSVDQSTIPYNPTAMAQRQSALLDPSSRLPFTKMQWRELMAQPEGAIARELTRIDWIMFSAIQPRDMLRHITVPASERCNYQELSNVTRWVEHFNHVAYWATNLVLLRDKPKHRALALEKLIRIARKLRELNNYNSLGAIIAGLQGSCIHRLAATHELLPVEVQKNFIKLQVLMSTQKGHSTYRLAWENSSKARIPFLPLHRRDLVVAEQGNKTFITVDDDSEGKGEKRINWNKFSILGSMLWDLYEAQSKPYKGLSTNEEVRRLLLDGGMVKDDDKLYERSQAVEANGTSGAGTNNARRRFAPWLARYGM